MRLPPDQYDVLTTASASEEMALAEIAAEAGISEPRAAGAAFALEEAGLVSLEERTDVSYDLTEEGQRYLHEGLPEVRLYDHACALDADEESVDLATVLEAAELTGDAVDIALSNFVRKGYGNIDQGQLSAVADCDVTADSDRRGLEAIDAGELPDESILTTLLRRGLIDETEHSERYLTVSEEGVDVLMAGVEAKDAVGAITPDHLSSGSWRELEYEAYNVEADAAPATAGKRHLLRQLADRVKEVLVGMGFQEMSGPHVDADFWINDCLFMPQDHPARTHWDRFELVEPTEIDTLPADLVERVEQAHRQGVGEDGEGYHSPWDERQARALALRGHTTSLTTRYLSGEAIGDLEPPQRFFSIEKAYRNDTIDPTHLLEFYQIEGWVMADSLSVRDLMGTFEEFYANFGITDIEFKPHYNPYTEPSFELFGTHPETGELIEIGNSGLFRDEMLEPLGIEHDVIAWGLALERLAMLVTGEADIRNLHGTLVDLAFLRESEVLY